MEFNYICNWFIRFVKDHADYKNCTDISFANEQDKKYFYENIFSEMLSFVNCIDSCGIRIEGHVDNKDRKVEFFEDSNFNKSSHRKYWVSGRTYEIEDTMTFPAFADLLRHRTYNKNIMAMHNIYPGRDYYIPEIIRGTEYESQWVEELEALAYIPQGKLITIRELGHIDYFILKAKERLCSRVQLEVLRVVKNQISEFSNRITRDPNNDNYEYAKHKLLEIYDFDNHVCKTKCQIVGKCSEPCVFGSSGCFTRKI